MKALEMGSSGHKKKLSHMLLGGAQAAFVDFNKTSGINLELAHTDLLTCSAGVGDFDAIDRAS